MKILKKLFGTEQKQSDLVSSLSEVYADPKLYTPSNNSFSPPSERLDHVVRFELTTGCSWNGCTFCDGYKDTLFGIKSLDEYKAHVDEAWRRIGKKSKLAKGLERVFIGGGDVLSADTELLREAIKYTAESFAKNTKLHWDETHLPKRIAVYGRTKNIISQGEKGLKRIAFNSIMDDSPKGLDLIYWGLESGSSNVLDYVNKGCTKEQVLEAGDILMNKAPSRLNTSVMIITGLGGAKFSDRHVNDTAEVLGEIQPKFLTMMGINPSPNSAYTRKMAQEEKEGTNRPLTDEELANQMIDLIERMPFFRTTIGCFGCDIDKVGHNPLNFGSVTLSDEIHKNLLVDSLRYKMMQVGIK